jgi:hypothetical protein
MPSTFAGESRNGSHSVAAPGTTLHPGIDACRYAPPSVAGGSTGAPSKVLGESSTQISLGSDEDFLLEGVIEEPIIVASPGSVRSMQLPTDTRLGRKPCQAPAWLTMIMFWRHSPPWRHRRRALMTWCGTLCISLVYLWLCHFSPWWCCGVLLLLFFPPKTL